MRLRLTVTLKKTIMNDERTVIYTPESGDGNGMGMLGMLAPL